MGGVFLELIVSAVEPAGGRSGRESFQSWRGYNGMSAGTRGADKLSAVRGGL